MLIQQSLGLPQLNILKLKWQILDFLYPPFCCSCGRIGYEICPTCFAKIEETCEIQVCHICGDLTQRPSPCTKCEKDIPEYKQMRSWGVYSGVLREAIHRLKYERGLGIINTLLEPIIIFLQTWKINPELIMAVPLSPRRLRSRGYNQSEIIAKPIAENLGINYSSKGISRIRDTQSQVGLTAKQRKKNLLNAFHADGAICNKKIVLLVDDIATTGTTFNEGAKALKQAGAKEVFCFTLARAFGFSKFPVGTINN